MAQQLKAEGKTLNELIARKVQQLHGPGAQFDRLTAAQQNGVYAEIVKSAGKSNPRVTQTMRGLSRAGRGLSRAGRGLIVLSLALSVYNVATAQDKVAAAGRGGGRHGRGGSAAASRVARSRAWPAAPVRRSAWRSGPSWAVRCLPSAWTCSGEAPGPWTSSPPKNSPSTFCGRPTSGTSR